MFWFTSTYMYAVRYKNIFVALILPKKLGLKYLFKASAFIWYNMRDNLIFNYLKNFFFSLKMKLLFRIIYKGSIFHYCIRIIKYLIYLKHELFSMLRLCKQYLHFSFHYFLVLKKYNSQKKILADKLLR